MDEDFAAEILLIASQGLLMVWLTAEERSEDQRCRAIECLTKLHRDGQLDVLEHLNRPIGRDEHHLDYAAWSSVYRAIIPLLDEDAGRVVLAVVSLAAGIWEPVIHEAFLDWCRCDSRRINAVLRLKFQPEIPDFCFAAALIAGLQIDSPTYLGSAIEYAHGNLGSRMPGIRAIGAMSVEDEAVVQRAIAALGTVVDDKQVAPRDRADALTAAFEVTQRCAGPVDNALTCLVTNATASGEAELLHACCHALVRFGRKLRAELEPFLLAALRRLDIDQQERLTADSALYSLFARERDEEALACLETLVLKSKAQEPLDALVSTTHYLARGSIHLLPVVICRWLLTGDMTLCAAARYLLSSAGNQNFVFDFAPGNQGWPDSRTLFLARKAIGWLMPHATAPASFVVCLLREASEDAGKELGKLLFDPLLVNYPLAARSYLEAICPSLPLRAKSRLEEVLAHHDRYKGGIEAVGYVPELQPVEHHRWLEARRRHDEWSKIQTMAEGRSVLAKLFSRQAILYSARVISYVDNPSGGTRRLDNRMGIISHTADNAMGWVYDPCDLDFILRVFRAELSRE